MSSTADHEVVEIQRPPEPGFALTYIQSLPPATASRNRPSARALLQAALLGVAIQLALAAVIGLVALVFIEDLHSE
ncbi:hypothetical protein [Sporichthya polymorpha]|uniref:hypothetical protein n=1 Tax=Sporichthya polymorpha TaxID=35751 RepID=UPI00036FF416|nr:hypothetical protein [Sporichthya polymorpha]